MRTFVLACSLVVGGGASAAAQSSQSAAAQTSQSAASQTPQWQMPPEGRRCPSRWGAGDQRGSANWMSPQTVLRAAKLIKTGETFELGAVLSPDPKETYINDNRVFNIYTKPSMPEAGKRVENEELVVTELGQIGTQLDALVHQMWGDDFYNCFKFKDVRGRDGFKKLGVDQVGTLMTRGVLIDVAASKGVDMLQGGYVITDDDLKQALDKEHTTLQPGDAVIINTGWGKLMGKDNVRYGKTVPGIGRAAGQWLVTQQPMLVGADNCCVEVRPSEPGTSLPIHSMMIIQNGILLLENLVLEKVATEKAYEFAFVMQPLKIKGATGSTVAPTAFR
jgi:kynurenine formamidase